MVIFPTFTLSLNPQAVFSVVSTGCGCSHDKKYIGPFYRKQFPSLNLLYFCGAFKGCPVIVGGLQASLNGGQQWRQMEV